MKISAHRLLMCLKHNLSILPNKSVPGKDRAIVYANAHRNIEDLEKEIIRMTRIEESANNVLQGLSMLNTTLNDPLGVEHSSEENV